MMENQFSISEFEQVLKKCLLLVSGKMSTHLGVNFVLKNRLKFERWLHIELISCFLKEMNHFKFDLYTEKETDSKSSKKGLTLDLAFKKADRKLIGIELKTIPTNYHQEEVIAKNKRISDDFSEFITDLNKIQNEGYEHAYSIAFIYPFPNDLQHRNYNDIKKQTKKINKNSKLEVLEANVTNSFKSYFYILKPI